MYNLLSPLKEKNLCFLFCLFIVVKKYIPYHDYPFTQTKKSDLVYQQDLSYVKYVLIFSSTIGSQATGCEIHFKGQSKESQLLSTEKQDKTKVTAVRYFHCHSSLFSTCTLILILVTWHCFPHLQTLKRFQDNGPSYIMQTHSNSLIYVFIFC